MDEEYRMYIIVNSDAKMSKGKIASQVGHAVMAVTEIMVKEYPQLWRNYVDNGIHPKICLKACSELMYEICHNYDWVDHPNRQAWCRGIKDAGRTQVEPGTLTALAFCPMKKSTMPRLLLSVIEKLKLL